MKIETLKKSYLKRNIIIGVVAVLIISAVILNFTRAKYKVTQSIPLVNGTINYIPYDFKMIAMYQENDNGEYENIDIMPNSGYIIDELQSYCTVDGKNKDENARLYTNTSGEHVISNLQKGSKCYLYFDKYRQPTLQDIILSNATTIITRSSFSSTISNSSTGTIYYEDTNSGRTYYFAGNPTDNWVKFANYYWRIIRINEDGTIRMIYQGINNSTEGEDTIAFESAFNSSAYLNSNNMFVGFMYGSNSNNYELTHKNLNDSTVKKELDTWYQNHLVSYDSKIDVNNGFCGDRTPSTSSSEINESGGTGNISTYYAAYIRLYGTNNNEPTFECKNSNDLYTTKQSTYGNKSLTYPIGLVSADEAWFAGGYKLDNNNYYLYTGKYYYTISPSQCGSAYTGVIIINGSGKVENNWVHGKMGVRPVINLKSDVTISSGDGTSTNPYVISD